MVSANDLSWRQILRFYLPLVLTSQLMTISGPIVNFGIGRSSDPTAEFAGYWLGFGVLLFLESPVLATQQVSATLLEGYASMRRLLGLALGAGVASSALCIAVAVGPAGVWVFRDVIPTTETVAMIARDSLLWQSAIPTLIAIRGVANGLAIRERRTELIARATFVRMSVLSTGVGLSVLLHTGSGARAGAAALTTGILIETLTVLWGTRALVRRRFHERRDDPPFPMERIGRVAVPLVVSGMVWTGLRPVVNAVLGQLPDPEVAQAGFGVVLPLMLLTTSPLWILQNVGLVLPKTRRDLDTVLRFTLAATTLFTAVLLLVNLEPFRGWLLRGAFGLDSRLELQVAPALLVLLLEPWALAARATAQGLLMRAHRTTPLLYFSPIKLALVALTGFVVATKSPGVNGTLLATSIWVGGEVFDACVFGWFARRLVRGGLFPTEMAQLPTMTLEPVSGSKK